MYIEEIRIGNWVKECPERGGKPYQITYRNFDCDKDGFNHWTDLSDPILLTEEWLFKLGFVYRNENKGLGAILDFKHPTLGGCGETGWKYNKSVALVHDKNDNKDMFYTFMTSPTAYKLRYVHQLQNLYFALTGKELEIKEGFSAE